MALLNNKLISGVSALTCMFISARTAVAAPAAYLERSAIVGTGQTITITRVPVTTSGGGTIYEDVVVGLSVGGDGSITYSGNAPVVTPSPNVLVSDIALGKYVDTSLAGAGFTITGPGVTFGGGYSVYSVSLTSGKGCGTVAAPSTFYSGPVKGTPLAARVAKAKINTSHQSFGEAGSGNCAGSGWPTNGLLGFSRSGNVVTVTSYSYNNGTLNDTSGPVDSRNFVLQN